MEKALTLKEVAELLGLSYHTIFEKRYQIGFRLPGSRVWRVWPEDLQKLRPQKPAPRASTTIVRDYDMPLVRQPFRTPASIRETERELDRLLAQRPGRKKSASR